MKPTPTSVHDKTGRTTHSNTYDEKADSYTYLASASAEAYMVRVTNKITTSLTVIPSRDGSDEALERLQSAMLAASQGPNAKVTITNDVQDPEAVKKRAEEAEKQRLRTQRQTESRRAKELEKNSRVFGRANARGGLTIGDLEEGDSAGGARRAPRAKPRRQQRRDDYSDDEEYGGARGRSAKEDFYDEEDDFIAASDDEDEDRDAEGEDEEEDIDAILESREREQHRERAGTPKRSIEDNEPAATQDSPVRTKRRRVVEDDDDDE
jgi:RNA polymerase-associated protein LEO1